MKRTITCLLALALALSLAACTPAAEEPSPSASGAGGGENKTAFTAGTYTGTARGREGNVSLEVTFSADAIESITLKEHNDTPVIFNAAFEEISGTITAHQSLAVETVAGATISSNAILGAVKDCVKQAGGSVEALMAEIPKKNTQESLKADVVVVGGGGAGLAAAVEAANQGAKVILVEAQGMTGGSTGLSTGMLISAASEQEKNEHGALMLDDMINALKLYGSEYYDESISRPFLAASRENRDWVMGLSRAAGYDVNITYESCFLPFDPEHPEEPGDTADYTVVMAETQDYIDTLIDGPLGFWITEGLYKAAREAGVEIYLNTRANEVLSENGAATGIRAVNARTGVTYTVEAKSVVLACGGFGADAEWAKPYTDPGGPYMGAVANTGFGIRAAEELGAKTLYTTVYGTEDYPEVYATIGGVVINNEMQVLNESDEPIAGLYSAGEMASVRVMDPPHLYSGHNNAWGVYSGRTAGSCAADYALGK